MGSDYPLGIFSTVLSVLWFMGSDYPLGIFATVLSVLWFMGSDYPLGIFATVFFVCLSFCDLCDIHVLEDISRLVLIPEAIFRNFFRS